MQGYMLSKYIASTICKHEILYLICLLACTGIEGEQNPASGCHRERDNFCRIHSTLRITPAMASGITDRVWTIEEVL